MPCNLCKTKPVIKLTNNNITLCKSCFVKYFERKIAKTISKYSLIEKKDSIAIAVSSGKDSLSLLYFLTKLTEKKRELKLKVILMDEGIRNYRNFSFVKEFCKNHKLESHIYSFKEEFDLTLDEILKKTDLMSCTVCGTLRRYILNKKARSLKVSKLATGHNLDDEAQSILMNQFKNDIKRSAILGPITGVLKHKQFIPRIKPLYFITEEETSLYAKIKNFPVNIKVSCPYSKSSFRNQVKILLNSFEKKYPGTKHAIVNSFLTILPLLKNEFKKSEIKTCKLCKELSSSDICNTCKLLKEIKGKF